MKITDSSFLNQNIESSHFLFQNLKIPVLLKFIEIIKRESVKSKMNNVFILFSVPALIHYVITKLCDWVHVREDFVWKKDRHALLCSCMV